jgi:hypothetical protein
MAAWSPRLWTDRRYSGAANGVRVRREGGSQPGTGRPTLVREMSAPSAVSQQTDRATKRRAYLLTPLTFFDNAWLASLRTQIASI